MRRIVGLLAAVAAVLALLTVPSAASAAPRTTWQHRPGHYPVVYVERHVSTHHWHVKEAVRSWRAGLRLGHCPHPEGCIRVYTRNLGPNGYVGLTWPILWHGRMYGAKIVLNTWYSYLGRPVMWEAAKHEMGHALGLPHDRSGGVMWNGDDGSRDRISQFERGELRRMYLNL